MADVFGLRVAEGQRCRFADGGECGSQIAEQGYAVDRAYDHQLHSQLQDFNIDI